jgi:purine-nucleoside phosphorylase
MTPHNSATKGEIAPMVLAPGDPERAKLVAQHYLADARLVSSVRGMLAYTGYYNDTLVSVMATGMGSPSAGIYTYELYTAYDVEAIIRIGTCGGLQPFIEVGDLVLAMTASTDSGWAHQYRLDGTLSPVADSALFLKAVECARERSVAVHSGMVFSSDLFSSYNALGEESWRQWARMGALAQDMETYALYATAAWTGKRALSILTMTDSCTSGSGFGPQMRTKGLLPMIELALELASKGV